MSNNRSVEIISLIYKSPSYLSMICGEILKTIEEMKDSEFVVTGRILANDASEEILELLPKCGLPFTIYNDEKPGDFWLNRVYRAWNMAGFTCTSDIVCFVNSDMQFYKGFLANLLKYDTTKYVPTSRLIESGKLTSGLHAISKNFGRTPETINRAAFDEFCSKISQDSAAVKGLFMPCLINVDIFRQSGGYPNGNIYELGEGRTDSRFVQSGDAYYFYEILEKKFGLQHITVGDSLCLHIQNGEQDE